MNAYWNCLSVIGTPLPRAFNGLPRTPSVERTVESGRSRIPRTVAEATPTPAAPSPRSTSSCTNDPPKEWPMRIGGLSSARITLS